MKRKKNLPSEPEAQEPEIQEEPMLSESLELDDILQDFRDPPPSEESETGENQAQTPEEATENTVRLDREVRRETLRAVPPPA